MTPQASFWDAVRVLDLRTRGMSREGVGRKLDWPQERADELCEWLEAPEQEAFKNTLIDLSRKSLAEISEVAQIVHELRDRP